jgi:hypothetical protein
VSVGHRDLTASRAAALAVLSLSIGPTGACHRPVVPSTLEIRVPLLTGGRSIDVRDASLREWPETFMVWDSGASPGGAVPQWSDVRGRAPAPLSQRNDVRVRLYMAHDDTTWFIAAAVNDDHVIAGPQEYPYSGDCLEVFAATAEGQSTAEIHELAESRDVGDKPAFFQLLIPPGGDGPLRAFFSTYATDPSWRKIGGSGHVHSWKVDDTTWAAEAAVPLTVSTPLLAEQRQIKVGFDYLDYDSAPAPPHDLAPNYGFFPDNVVSHDRSEKNVMTPRLMPTAIFAGWLQ